uniref:EGF-like domain-containing protein n=1 Tax=Clastoptera arizonana TaxID=38151 RepID=A0A1B6E2K9_9HEMI
MVWTDINFLPQILGILCIFVILGDCNEEYDISGHHGQGCHPNLFECVSGECLDLKYHCDGIEQCKDKSDEENCDFFNCIGPNWFKCKTGRCIKQTFLCDGNDDCNDFSDENNCPDIYEHFMEVSDCPPSKFKCVKDGSCIPENWACDGHANCIDGSDEVEGCMGKVHCNGNIFCNNTHHCIEKDFLCDGVDDCGDGEDERNCFNNVALNDCTIENHKFQCKDKSHCIDLDKVCDHTPDCFDLSDENGKCYDINQCVLAKCPNNCSLTPTGPVCFCPYGSKLVGENCIDIDECLEFGKCDQHCLNIKNGYNCFCEPGYELASDGHTCIVEDGEGLLLFTTQNQIFGFTLKSETYFPISHVNRAIGVAYDGQYVYWTNTVNTIVRSLKNGSDLTVVVDSGLLLPEDLAIDLITKNIYFTDSIQQHIGVCSNDGFSCTILHNKDIDKPRGICLQIKEGLMYWTDWGARPLIARSGMDGSDVTDFVTTNLDWPNGITIDYGNDRLYWVDAKQLVIESIKLDGSDRRMVLDKAALKHPFSVAVFEDSLYWSDLEGNEIQACNKFTGKNVRSIVRQTKNLIYGIHVYHDSIKHSHSLENPCKYAGCTDMCLLAPVSRPLRYTCACPEDKFLAANGHQCNSGKRFPSIMVGIGNTLIQVEPKKLGKMRFHEHVLSEVEKIGALAYDELTGNIIISDSAAKKFFSVDLNTGYSTHLLSGDIGKVEGIDVDPLGHNMYWVDSERLTVEIISLKSLERTVLLRDFGGDSPVDIALAPNKGFMFIALSGPRGTHIDRFYMNGHNRVHLVDSDLIGPAINLAYNKYADKLFWVDSGSGLIERGDIDGLERYSFIKSYNTPKLLTTLENGIFWVSYGIPTLEYANIFEENPALKEIALNAKIGSDYLRITAVKDRIAAASHRCQTNNGGCSHFCLIIPNDNVCGCPNGLSLQTDGLTCEKPMQCSTRQFHCKTGECIPDSLRCDYKNDCPEGDDELHCAHYSIQCPKGQFSCLNGEKCVDDQEKCNGHAVCYDGSDEHNCHLLNMSCYQGNFKCRSGECIPSRFKCDGSQDCNDASDENGCEKVTCGSNEFRCINGGCIPSSWECDGEFDCKDGSDEANSKCESKKTCSPSSFRCDNGGCVESILRCNGADDCGDSSDESVCSSQYFNNDDDFDNLNTDIAGHIIDDSVTLEVIHNCKEKSEFKCESQPEKCLPIEAKCNGTSECLRGEDETNCSGCSNDEFECVENKRCILREWICDNTNDCIDNSDEDPFMCKYHNKTLLTKLKGKINDSI